VLAAFAVATERIRLGTGVAPIFARTPVAMAQVAATLDELSGGRMVLGLGVSHQVTVEHWFGSEITKPVAQMREYAGAGRAVLRGWAAPGGGVFHRAFPVRGLRRPPRPSGLRRGSLTEHAPPRRRDRGRRDAVALRPRLHPHRRDPGRARRA